MNPSEGIVWDLKNMLIIFSWEVDEKIEYVAGASS